MPTESTPENMAKLEEQYRREICLVGRWMYERGHIVACEGNLSIRLDANRILTTPTCLNKGMMSPEDLVIMDMEGKHLQGDRKISSEAGDYHAGTRAVVAERVGTFICYESVFPTYIRQFARDGAEVLFNISNDGWFGKSAAAEQHLRRECRPRRPTAWLLVPPGACRSAIRD